MSATKMNVTASMDGTDPSQAPSSLKLTGNAILATATMPYKALFVKDTHGWVSAALVLYN